MSPPANAGEGQNPQPGGAVPAAGEMPTQPYATTADTTMAPYGTGPAGDGVAFDSVPHCTAIDFIIALQGIFPSRS